MTSLDTDAVALINVIRPLRRVVVAFSGGVDSSVVAAAAAQADLESLVAVTALSPSVSMWQLEMAKRVAGELDVEHRVIKTNETERPEYIQNDGQRCFFCKQTLYQTLNTIREQSEGANGPGATTDQIVSGTNADDLGDYRPGIEAGRLASVHTPLADLGFGKEAVRAIARQFGLSNAETPASPCLASRVAYGVQVTPERLQRIEKAESWLRQQGFSDCRVRVHEGELARVEVYQPEISRFYQNDLLTSMSREFQSLGFNFVSLDAAGLRSGNLNQMLVKIDASER